MPQCLNCNKEFDFKRMTKNKYCGHSCQQEFQRKEYIRLWKLGEKNGERGLGQTSLHIKKYLFEKYNNTCTCCGINSWNKKPIVLEVEHLDGDSTNNKEENLTILCPNCHSQTQSFKGANRGKGRHQRKIRYQEGKSF